MKQFAFFVFLMAICISVSAHQRSDEETIDLARRILTLGGQKARKAKAVNEKLAIVKRLENLSVVKDDNIGFVLVANDEESTPVLGYSFTKYDEKELPENFTWWVNAINSSLQKKKVRANLPTQYPQSVSPLLKTTWGQSTPFNNKCPKEGSERCLTGCVATAMAQVLYYYHYPLQGTGSYTYNNYTFDYGKTVFQWGNMLADYTSSTYNSTQANAVATLMYACGVSVEMNYGLTASSAYFVKIRTALKNYFSCNEGSLYDRDTYGGDWMELIYNEISSGRPIIYSGQNTVEGGHAFVIDGYDSEGLVHVNWGWEGQLDGYFNITNLDPENNGGYNNDQLMIIGFRNYEEHPNLTMNTLSMSGTKLVGDSQTITATVSNSGSNFNGTINLFVSQAEGLQGNIYASQTVSINNGQSKNIVFNYTPQSASSYYLTLAIDENGKDIVGTGTMIASSNSGNIAINDAAAKRVCISNWDSNGDGELSYAEAASVTSLGRAFWANGTITDLSFLQYFTGLTEIPVTAFSGCDNLTTIVLPNGIKEIGSSAFWDCYSLLSLNIPASVEEIGSDFFRRCKSLTDFNVDSGNQYYTSKDGIIFDKSMTTLVAFPPAKNITSYTIPNTVTSIFDNAFVGNRYLEEVVITSNVKDIGGNSFSDCTSLKTVNVPDNVETIGCNTWAGCTSLTSAYIGKGVSFMKNDLFGECTSLEAINVSTDNQYYCSVDGLILSKDKTVLYQYPSGKKSSSFKIPDYIKKNYGDAFRGCKYLKDLEIHGNYKIDNTDFWYIPSLENVVIDEGIQSIGNGAFSNDDNLKTVKIPSTVHEIKGNAFSGCKKMESITSHIEVPFDIDENNFASSTFSSATLFVPVGSRNLYQQKAGWKKFRKILEIGEEPTKTGDVNGDDIVNGTDIVALVSIIMGLQSQSATADVNGDGQVNGTDIVSLVSFILNSNN